MKPLLFIVLFSSVAIAADPATHPSRDPTEIRRGIAMGGDPEDRSRRVYENLVRKIEPSLQGDVKKLEQYIELFKRECVEDTRTFAFNVRAETTDGKPAITGYIEFPEHKQALMQFFRHLKLPEIDDRTELLMATSPGIVTAERTFIFDRPEKSRENLTECLRDDVVFLLKEDGAWLLVHGPSGYVGYIAAADVKRVDALPATPVREPQRIETVIAAASKLMGVKYVWGGVSEAGVDCSGLVYTGFKAAGIAMPRDADQQSLVGRLVATRWNRSGLRRGDTLYFLGRRGTITHTALYLGDDKYIEATGPAVKITSFNPSDENYSERRDKGFCFAKRVIE